jgi:hypothetical protein
MAARSSKRSQNTLVNVTAAIAKVPRQQAADFVSVYANNATLATAYYDITTMFSEIQADKDGKILIVEKCRIVMNPAHAKALANALNKAAAQWESQFGELRLPPGLAAGTAERPK